MKSSFCVSTGVVSNFRKAPLAVIAIAMPAAVIVSGPSMSAKPSLSPNEYHKPSSLQPTRSRTRRTVSSRFSGWATKPAQTSGSYPNVAM